MGKISEGGVGVLELEEEPEEDIREDDLELHLQVPEGGREGGMVICEWAEGRREGGKERRRGRRTYRRREDQRHRIKPRASHKISMAKPPVSNGGREEGREERKGGISKCVSLVCHHTLPSKRRKLASVRRPPSPPSLPPLNALLTSRHLQQRQAQVIADEGKEGGAGREGGTGRFKSLSDEPEADQTGGLVVGVSGR